MAFSEPKSQFAWQSIKLCLKLASKLCNQIKLNFGKLEFYKFNQDSVNNSWYIC